MAKPSYAQLRRRRRGQDDRLVDPHISQVRREAVMKRWARAGKVYTPTQAELGVHALPVVAKGGMTLLPKSERRQDALMAARAVRNIESARIGAMHALVGALDEAVRVIVEILVDRTVRPEVRLAAAKYIMAATGVPVGAGDDGSGQLCDAQELAALAAALKAELAEREARKAQEAQRTLALRPPADGANELPDDSMSSHAAAS